MSCRRGRSVIHVVDKKLDEVPAADLDVEKTEAIERDPLAARLRCEIQLKLLIVERGGNPAVAASRRGVVVQRPASGLEVRLVEDAFVGFSVGCLRGGII